MRFFIALVVLFLIGSMTFKIVSYFHTETFKAKVTSKERIVETDDDNKIESFYLVYTDKGTLKLEDDVLRGNWESSDVYGKLKNDSSYTFTTTGYRFSLFSIYPNIIEVR
jgi:hypothetical protein